MTVSPGKIGVRRLRVIRRTNVAELQSLTWTLIHYGRLSCIGKVHDPFASIGWTSPLSMNLPHCRVPICDFRLSVER